jgi:hypothetical protein
MYLIHHPSPFASTKEWREFLAWVLKMPQNDWTVRWAVECATKELREREEMERGVVRRDPSSNQGP